MPLMKDLFPTTLLGTFSALPPALLCLYRSKDVSRRYLVWGWNRQGETLDGNISTYKDLSFSHWLVLVGGH
jgi:hypothetical protein